MAKVIEFFGMPRAGKTEQIYLFSKYLKKKRINHKIIIDREIIEKEIKVPISKALEFETAFYKKILEKLLDAERSRKYDVIILDRGFLDSLVWFNVEYNLRKISKQERDESLKYMNSLHRYIDFGIFMMVDMKTALQRHWKKGEVGVADEYVLTGNYFKNLYREYKKLKKELKSKENVLIINGKDSQEKTELKIRKRLIEKGIIRN